MKKSKIIIIAGVSILVLAWLIAAIYIDNKGNHYLTLANEHIDKEEMDSVSFFIKNAKDFYPNKSDNEAVKLENEINNLTDSLFVLNFLGKMSDEEFTLLNEGLFEKEVLNQKTLNRLFIEKLKNYSSKRDAVLKQLKIEEEEKLKAEEEKGRQKEIDKRKKLVSSQFNEWDGAHPGLVIFVRNSMNDPKSFEHVETRYRDDGDSIFVVMKFRGNNKFGAKVLNTVNAKVDFKGNVIEVKQQ